MKYSNGIACKNDKCFSHKYTLDYHLVLQSGENSSDRSHTNASVGAQWREATQISQL